MTHQQSLRLKLWLICMSWLEKKEVVKDVKFKEKLSYLLHFTVVRQELMSKNKVKCLTIWFFLKKLSKSLDYELSEC